MRASLIAAACVGVLLAGTQAQGASRPGCVASHGGYQRVIALSSAAQACCTGRLQCPQYLSTTRVVRPAHDQRT